MSENSSESNGFVYVATYIYFLLLFLGQDGCRGGGTDTHYHSGAFMTTPCDKYLEAVEGRVACSTKGPWFQNIDCILGDTDLLIARLNVNAQVAAINGNGRFISHSRADLETLARMVRVAREALVTQRARFKLEQFQVGVDAMDTTLAELDRLASEGTNGK